MYKKNLICLKIIAGYRELNKKESKIERRCPPLIIWFELKHLSPSDLFFFSYVTQFDINIGVTQQTSSLLYNNRSDILLFIVFICSSRSGYTGIQ